ncbi:RING finger protein 212B [Nymphon striatum]|nr:RING finger protein 212B [Nymphon striatum]
MADWIHCNKCFVKPTRELKRKFMLTSCSHMFCDQCLLEKKCHICKATCNVIVLSQQMKPDVEIFFKDPSQQLKKLTQVINFRLIEFRFFEKREYCRLPSMNTIVSDTRHVGHGSQSAMASVVILATSVIFFYGIPVEIPSDNWFILGKTRTCLIYLETRQRDDSVDVKFSWGFRGEGKHGFTSRKFLYEEIAFWERQDKDKIATAAQLGKQAHDRKLKLTRNIKLSENPKIFIFETFFKSAYSSAHSELSSIFLRRLLEGLEQEEIIDRKESAEGRTPNLPYSKPISQAELLVRLFENLEGQILTFYIKLRVVFKLLVTSCLSNWQNSQLKDILMNALNLHLKTGKCFLIKTAFSDATHICYRHAFASGIRQKTSFCWGYYFHSIIMVFFKKCLARQFYGWIPHNMQTEGPQFTSYEFQSQLKASNIIDVESLPYSLASNGASEYQQVPLKKLIFAYPFKDGRTSSGKIMFNRKMQIHWFDHLLTNIQLQSGQSKFNPQVQDAISEDGILNLNLNQLSCHPHSRQTFWQFFLTCIYI